MAVILVDPDDLKDVEIFSCACEMYCCGLETRDPFWLKYLVQMAVRCLSAQTEVFSPYLTLPWSTLVSHTEDDSLGRLVKVLVGCVLQIVSF